jgi:4-hydroxybenzoate polyprenyltransferase
MTMFLRFPLRQYLVIKHFIATRALEVFALQASPLLGAVTAGVGRNWVDMARLALLLSASLALTAHVFVLNDWAGQSNDVNDSRRARQVFGQRNIGSREVAGLATALLLLATAALAVLGLRAVFLGCAIAALSVLYSCSPLFGKGTPIWGSLIHVVGGALHFLLGYSLVSAIDTRGVAISVFFGLVFAGGHLNQEVRDYDGDLRNAIRTNAVVFGCRRTFYCSLIVFNVAYAVLAGLAAVEMLPRVLLWCVLICPWHVAWSLQAVQFGLGYDAACWMQRRYRLLFAVVGLAMLLTAGTVRPSSSLPDSPLVRLMRNVAQGFYDSRSR